MNNMAAEIIMQVGVPNFSTPSSLSQVDKALQQVMNNIVCLSVFDIFTLFEVLHQLKNNLRSQVFGNTTLVSLLSSPFP